MKYMKGLNFSEINIHRRNFTPLSINACKSRGGTGGKRVERGWMVKYVKNGDMKGALSWSTLFKRV